MRFEEIKKLDEEYIVQLYARYPIALVRGEGTRVWDSEGRDYLDLIAGIASCPLGHSHPKLVRAISEQAGRLMHVSNLFYIEEQVRLAKMLNDLSPMDVKAFFCNSGAEANEAAIKFSRKITRRRGIIAMSNSFHGRTMGSLAITDKKRYQKSFEPLMPEAKIVEYGNAEALRSAIGDKTAAIFVELIQGEGGIRFPRENFEESREYFREIRELCDEKGVIMVVDEVQTGTGRTGSFFASEQFGIKPDIITVAKGIAGGFPMGVTLVDANIAGGIEKGDHASTFGGNPLACAAAIATIETIVGEGLMENARRVGKYAISQAPGKARGLGLMIGVEVEDERKAEEAMIKMRERGFLVNVTSKNVVRMVPPLIITKEEMGRALENLEEVLK